MFLAVFGVAMKIRCRVLLTSWFLLRLGSKCSENFLSCLFACTVPVLWYIYPQHSIVYQINLYFKNINRKSFCAHNVNVHYFLLILVYCMMYCICIVQGTILHFIEYKSKDLTSSHNLFCDGILPKRFSMNFQGIDLVLFFLPALRKQPLLYQLLYVSRVLQKSTRKENPHKKISSVQKR
jgi:hypothetical protein